MNPIRVLHIASGDLWAGAEVQAFTLMSHLKQMPETEVVAFVMNEGTLAENLRSTGIGVHVADEREIGTVGIFLRMRSALRSWRPDVVHTHRVKENILGCLANSTFRNVPSVRTVHGENEHSRTADWRNTRNHVINYLDRWCGRMLQQRVIAVTSELARKLAPEFPIEKLVVIENGADFAAISRERGVAEYREAQPNATHVGIAGRLVDVKRVDLFLGAASLLLRDCPQREWKFHVFGEGPKRADLEKLALRDQLTDKVVFHGHRRDMATCIGGLDALVICSDHEGMPMISLEAAALALPVVAHAVGGLIDVVPSEFLVLRHDALGYKDGILRALCPDGRAIASKRAAEVCSRFSARRNAERVRALYEELIGGKKAKRRGERAAVSEVR